MYTAYVLTDDARAALMKQFPPKYERVVAHHITIDFGVPSDTPVPDNAEVELEGYTDSGDGLEALLVSVDGKIARGDGKVYHITWSLDPSKYKPVDSNKVIDAKGSIQVSRAPIATYPAVLG